MVGWWMLQGIMYWLSLPVWWMQLQCAVEIQKELKTRNAELPENRKMEFRIGDQPWGCG